MDLQRALFWIFSLVMLASGLLVITRRRAVDSAIFLIQLFLCTAGLFLLLEAFFLAVVQVLVYAGAVVVLFLFVIMLLEPDPTTESRFPRIAVFGSAALAAALGLAFLLLLRKPVILPDAPVEALQGDLQAVLKPLFTHNLLPFELTALIILSAMIGVVLLSKQDLNKP